MVVIMSIEYALILGMKKRRDRMPDYIRMYQELFRAATEAIEALQQAQIKAEELHLSAEEPSPIFILHPSHKDSGSSDGSSAHI